MSVRIGDEAPNFKAETTQGPIDFHQWIGEGYAVLFSHPKDFTPVCTTELGYMAKLEPEFKKRNTKVIGLSIDPVDDHKRWAKDIEETQGTAPNYPIIGKLTAVPWVSRMSSAHFAWLVTGSTLRPITLTLRFWKSGWSLAM